MSQITTHVLDTTQGKPAAGVIIVLEELTKENIWIKKGQGETNSDGRLPNLLSNDVQLISGTYRLVFDTAAYFKRLNIQSFYPSVSICFEVTDQTHYHVPLLLNPYGYSTYRGS